MLYEVITEDHVRASLRSKLVHDLADRYARGAFTGADTAKPGLCESADRGTLFLDEIGEMSPAWRAATAATSRAGTPARSRTSRAVVNWLAQISSGSCSTQPGRGNVITSYSIHYTKLYDSPTRDPANQTNAVYRAVLMANGIAT